MSTSARQNCAEVSLRSISSGEPMEWFEGAKTEAQESQQNGSIGAMLVAREILAGKHFSFSFSLCCYIGMSVLFSVLKSFSSIYYMSCITRQRGMDLRNYCCI